MRNTIATSHTLATRRRWSSDLRRVRSSDPGERRLCSNRVNSRATLRRVRSGDSSVEGNAVTAIIVKVLEKQGNVCVIQGTGPVNERAKFEDANRPRDISADSAFAPAHLKLETCKVPRLSIVDLPDHPLRINQVILDRLSLGYAQYT